MPESQIHHVTLKNRNVLVAAPDPLTSVALQIGDLSLGLVNKTAAAMGFDTAYRDFLSAGDGDIKVDIFSETPVLPALTARSLAEGYWRISEFEENLVFQIYDPHSNNCICYQTAILSSDAKTASCYYHPAINGDKGSGSDLVAPMEYPLDFLLYSKLLMHRQAIILHASAVLFEEKCYVFSGKKGAGKSTISRLWLEKGARILSEEQIVVRVRGGRTWAYGSPWYGETRNCANAGAPIDALFFISHGRENRHSRAGPAKTATALLNKAFIATAFRDEMPVLISTCSAAAANTPTYEYAFFPSPKAVDHVIGLTQ